MSAQDLTSAGRINSGERPNGGTGTSFPDFEHQGWSSEDVALGHHDDLSPITTQATGALLDAAGVRQGTRVGSSPTGAGYARAASSYERYGVIERSSEPSRRLGRADAVPGDPTQRSRPTSSTARRTRSRQFWRPSSTRCRTLVSACGRVMSDIRSMREASCDAFKAHDLDAIMATLPITACFQALPDCSRLTAAGPKRPNSGFAHVVLAEGEELSSNPLFLIFQ